MKNNEDGGISDAVITTTGVLVTDAVVTTVFCTVTVEAPHALCCLLSAASAAISLGVFIVAAGPEDVEPP